MTQTLTIDGLLEILADRKVELYLESGQLRYRGPADGVTQALLAVLKRHKLTLVERLGGTVAVEETPPVVSESVAMIEISWGGVPYKTVPLREYAEVMAKYANS